MGAKQERRPLTLLTASHPATLSQAGIPTTFVELAANVFRVGSSVLANQQWVTVESGGECVSPYHLVHAA